LRAGRSGLGYTGDRVGSEKEKIMPLRIGITGIAGRMGSLLAEEARRAGVLAGGTLRPGSAHPPPPEAPILPDIAALAQVSDVVIDFTHASAVAAHAEALAAAGTPWVLGTTGLFAADEALVAAAARRIAVCAAANFSPGVTLVLALAERMAAALPGDVYDAEIVEMHHRQKVDAPSGTAIGLGQAVARGRGVDLAGAMESGRQGHTGPRRPGAIGFASLRGGQVVGEHTLIFAAASEHIALTHRAFDRRVFAAGAVRAALWLAGREPGLYAMRDVLGLSASA
jgi:4-hydroxy-tetrahydrodipicolinate reductase